MSRMISRGMIHCLNSQPWRHISAFSLTSWLLGCSCMQSATVTTYVSSNFEEAGLQFGLFTLKWRWCKWFLLGCCIAASRTMPQGRWERIFHFIGTTFLITFNWRICFLEDCNPFLLAEVKHVKIVKFFSYLIDASKYNHVLSFKDITWVSASLQRIDAICRLDLLPDVTTNVKFPKIIKFIVIIISSPEHPHRPLVNYTWMATPCSWTVLTTKVYSTSPLAFLEEVLNHCVCPHSIQVSSKYDHGTISLIKYCCMLISRGW